MTAQPPDTLHPLNLQRKEEVYRMKNWKNLSKRGLALLVCLMMCLSMMPGVAHAGIFDPKYENGQWYCTRTHGGSGKLLLTRVEGKAATCTEDGMEAHWTCNGYGPAGIVKYDHNYKDNNGIPGDPFGSYEYTTIPSLGGHDWDDTPGYDETQHWDATCRRSGCGAHLNAKDHTFTNYVSNNDATCTADGTKTATCDSCAQTHIITDEDTKLPHTFTNYVSDNNASCTADGTKTATCDVCHDATDTITDVGTKLPHDPNTDGWEHNGEEHWHQCKNCDAKQDTADHVFDPWEIFEGNVPTAVAPGRVKHTCTVCGYSETKLIGSLNSDNWEATQTKDPTCTESGTKTYTWIGGGEYEGDDEAVSFEEEIPALGHDWNAWVVDPAPTKTTEGTATRTCKRNSCDKKETTTLPKLGEDNADWTYTETTAPGCETAGEATYTYKADGRVAGPVVIPALGHDVSTDWTQGDETHYHKCSRCEHTEDSQPHSYKWEITTESTKDAGGVATGTCSVCGKEVTKDIAPLDPDNLNAEWEFTSHKTLPSCTGTGIDVYTHKETGDSQEVIVDALGHDFSTGWTTDGVNHWHACSRCEARDAYSVHTSDGGVVTVNPTEDNAGVRTHTCTACGTVWTESIPALGTTPTLPVPDGTGGTGGTGTGDTGDTGTTVIDDQEVPLASIIFEDVLPSDWFYDAVNYVYNRGLMQGVSETRFDPYGTLTRAMVVTILYRLEGEPEAEPSAFKDVEAGQWYTDAIGWASSNEVVEGYDDERFGPMDPVTREQLAAILYRYAQYMGYDVTETADLAAYTDASSIHEYAVEAMGWAVALGAPTPLSENTLSPRENATRAQVAEAFMNFCEKYVPLETEGEAE